jgi:hypothetical protein
MKPFYFIFFLSFCTCTFSTSEKDDSLKFQHSSETVVNPYEKAIFKIETFALDSLGFGYSIYVDGERIIYQPNVPGLIGNKGFESEKSAQKVGEFVVFKIRKNEMPPSITPQELDSLGIL